MKNAGRKRKLRREKKGAGVRQWLHFKWGRGGGGPSEKSHLSKSLKATMSKLCRYLEEEDSRQRSSHVQRP